MTYRPPHGCGKCKARWSGLRMCHCRGCHRTFTGLSTYDAHFTRGVTCGTEAQLRKAGIVTVRPGVWGRTESGSESALEGQEGGV